MRCPPDEKKLVNKEKLVSYFTDPCLYLAKLSTHNFKEWFIIFLSFYSIDTVPLSSINESPSTEAAGIDWFSLFQTLFVVFLGFGSILLKVENLTYSRARCWTNQNFIFYHIFVKNFSLFWFFNFFFFGFWYCIVNAIKNEILNSLGINFKVKPCKVLYFLIVFFLILGIACCKNALQY